MKNAKISSGTTLVALTVLFVVLAFFLGGWTSYPKTFSQFRNPILILLFVTSGACLLNRNLFKDLRRDLNPSLLRKIILLVYGLAFLKATTLDFLSFNVHGLDGSIYDYAMMNTLRGRFMESVNGVNHFGIHATPILFLLLPFHALFHSPLFALFLHPIVLWIGAYLFDRCMAAREIDGWSRLGFLFAYLNSIWISRTLHYSFHLEIFYPVAVFLIDRSLWLKGNVTRSLSFWASALLLLSIKEDAPFHLIALVFAYFLIGKTKVAHLLVSIALSAAVAVLYLKWVVPLNAPSGTYRFASSAAGAGKNFSEAAMTLLRDPGHLLFRYFTGEWWDLILPSLGLLLTNPFFWIASAPLLGLYSLAGDSQMFSVTIYYAIPLVAPFFLGLLTGYTRIRQKWRNLAVVFSVLGVSVIGSGYLIFRKADIHAWRTVHADLVKLPKEASLCAAGVLVPQLPYGNIRLLDLDCLDSGEYALIPAPDSSINRYPISTEAEIKIREKIKTWDSIGDPKSQIEIFHRPKS